MSLDLSPGALSLGALAALVVSAAWWDLRARRVPIALCVGGAAAALAIHAFSGPDALAMGALGLVLGLVVALPAFAAGGLGGGDVKLLAAVGAFLGPGRLLVALVVTALFGGVVALVYAWRRGLLAESLANTARLARRLVPISPQRPIRTLATPGALAIPYAVPIAIGALVSWFL